MNILYIGSSGALSLLPFKKLLSSEHTIVAVGVHQPVVLNNKIIALENESLALAANQHLLKIIDLSLPVKQVLERCKTLTIDVVLMSCYGHRLPDEILSLAKNGCYNLHPSLLPQYRGPEPIFWQMKHNCRTGVSWHVVTCDFDAGDIVKQKQVCFDDGNDFEEISEGLANNGASLMLELLDDITESRLQCKAQSIDEASYFPYPTEKEFIVDTAWSAQHAYNFMRATEVFGYSFVCRIGSEQYLLDKALDYDNNEQLLAAQVKNNILDIPCNEGVLTASFTGKL